MKNADVVAIPTLEAGGKVNWRRGQFFGEAKDRRVSPSWSERSAIVFFYLHPQLGHEDLDLTSNAIGVNRREFIILSFADLALILIQLVILQDTLKTWISKPSFMASWIPFVEQYSTEHILKSMPSHLAEIFLGDKVDQVEGKLPAKIIEQFKAKVKSAKNAPKQTRLVHGGLSTISTAKKVALSRTHSDKYEFISSTTKRTRGGGRKNAYPTALMWLRSLFPNHWESGDLLTLDRVIRLLRIQFKSPDRFYVNLLDMTRKTSPNTLKKWLRRAMSCERWVLRDTTIMQEVPQNWDVYAKDNANDICKLIERIQPNAIVAADEVKILRLNANTASISSLT